MSETHPPVWNRTKIVGTIGPASESRENLLELIRAGLDVCRLNASHGSHEQLGAIIRHVRSINAEYSLSITLMLDLQGPKIRIGKLDAPHPIKTGDVIRLCTTLDRQEGATLPMELDTLARDVKPGDLVLVEDGKVELRALETNGTDTVTLEVISGEAIGSRKGVNLPYTRISLPSLTEKDLEDLAFAAAQQVDWIALSFVRKAEDVVDLRERLKALGSDARIIAKIEKPEALENIDAIIAATDAVMVARGDLGVEIPIENVPFWQKTIVRKCNAAAKPVIVATQMLESMIENKRPTRAEATDVANAVLDGADAVMLSGETSVGKYPVASVRVMQDIISRAEHEEAVFDKLLPIDEGSRTYYHDVTCRVACQFASEIGAKAIVGMTRSGYTAYQLSRWRPHAPIFIFTDNPALLTTLGLVWGVRAFFYDVFESTDGTIYDTVEILKEKGFVKQGDPVINTASMPMGERKRTNVVKVTIVR